MYCPLKQRLSLLNHFSYSNLFAVFLSILRHEGVGALYRGALFSLIGVLPYSGTVFFTYESLKYIRTGKLCQVSQLDIVFFFEKKTLFLDRYADRPINKAERMLYGAIAGLVGQTASYPFDVIRRRLQTAAVIRPDEMNLGGMATAMKIIRQEGIVHGLYKGVTMNWLKGPISVGISFMTFDTLLKFIRHSTVFSCNSDGKETFNH